MGFLGLAISLGGCGSDGSSDGPGTDGAGGTGGTQKGDPLGSGGSGGSAGKAGGSNGTAGTGGDGTGSSSSGGGSAGGAGKGSSGSGASATAGRAGTTPAGNGGNASGHAGNGGNALAGSGGAPSSSPDAGRGGSNGGSSGGAAGSSGTGASGQTGMAGTGTDGAAGSGGTGGSICKFASGLNVAWVQFAQDVPNPQTAVFDKIFKDTYDNGGRIVRWWFHTNGTITPGYNADGTVKKIQQSHIDGVKAILASAHQAGVGVVISLWSFDMAQDNAGNAAEQNKNLMTQDAIRQSYIDNYLTDLVTALKGTPGLYAYEIFNEPEGMATTGWATKWKIDAKYIQTAVNWWTAAIKAADPTVPVTSGCQTMDYRDNYKDSALIAAGGKATGTLDFYEVHYYQVNGDSNNVFKKKASDWGMTDKKLVIGEFAAYSNDTAPVTPDKSFTYLFDNGYDGAWAWSYTETNSNYAWPTMKTPMQNLFTAQKDTVTACP